MWCQGWTRGLILWEACERHVFYQLSYWVVGKIITYFSMFLCAKMCHDFPNNSDATTFLSTQVLSFPRKMLFEPNFPRQVAENHNTSASGFCLCQGIMGGPGPGHLCAWKLSGSKTKNSVPWWPGWFKTKETLGCCPAWNTPAGLAEQWTQVPLDSVPLDSLFSPCCFCLWFPNVTRATLC